MIPIPTRLSASVYASLTYSIVVVCGLLVVVFLTGAQPLPEPEIPEIPCVEAEDCFRNAVYFADSNPNKLDLQRLRFLRIQERFPGSIWSKRAGLRTALVLETDHPAEALAYWESADQHFPLLHDYIELHHARVLQALEKPIEAAELLDPVIASEPSPAFRSDILYEAGQARFKAQQCPQALLLLRQAYASDPDGPEAPEALYAIAACTERLRLHEKSRGAFQELWWRFPDSPESKILDEMWQADQSTHGSTWSPTPELYYQRAMSYMKLARFESAIADLRVFLESQPPNPRLEQAQFKLAMAYVRLKRYPLAEKIFHALAQNSSLGQGRATVWLARALLRQGKGKELLSLRNALPASLSQNDRSQIFWMCGIWFEDQGAFDASILSYEQAVSIGGSPKAKAEALWRLGWLQYQGGNFEKALAAFQQMDDQVANPARNQQAQYWHARTLSRLGKMEEAQLLFRRLAEDFPLTYYGQLARQQLHEPGLPKRLTESGPHPDNEASERQAPYRDSVHFQRSQEFRQLGLMIESSLELMQVVESFRSDRDSLSRLAIHLMETRAYDSALGVARRYFGEQLEQGQVPRSSLLWHVAYPRGYLSQIQAYAGTAVDPYLVAGIIREESLYNPRALSPVGAIGLMQLMPNTANRVANQLGLPPIRPEDLFQGETNIRLGVRYVGQLLEQFHGNLAYTVAAYNAGPRAVARWISNFGSREPDEFVELITYRETRGYVKRVLTSYRAYHHLSSTICSASSLDMSC